MIFDLFLGLPLLSLSLFTLLGAIWRSLVAGAMMVAAVLTLAAYWQTDLATGSMLLLIMYATVGAVTYSAGVFFLWIIAGLPRGCEYHMITLLRSGLELLIRKMRHMSQAARVTPRQSKFPGQSL